MQDSQIKLKWLVNRLGYNDTRLAIQTSLERVKHHIATGSELPKTVQDRLETLFRHTLVDDKLHELKIEYADQMSTVKNYDYEELEEVKAGTSRHGVNRRSSSFATSNNGLSF